MWLGLLWSAVEYQYERATKTRIKLLPGNCWKGKSGINLPNHPPAHPAEHRPVGWRYVVVAAKIICQRMSCPAHKRSSAAIRGRCFGRLWAVKVMAVGERIG